MLYSICICSLVPSFHLDKMFILKLPVNGLITVRWGCLTTNGTARLVSLATPLDHAYTNWFHFPQNLGGQYYAHNTYGGNWTSGQQTPECMASPPEQGCVSEGCDSKRFGAHTFPLITSIVRQPVSSHTGHNQLNKKHFNWPTYQQLYFPCSLCEESSF
jgi:hypothetical protein